MGNQNWCLECVPLPSRLPLPGAFRKLYNTVVRQIRVVPFAGAISFNGVECVLHNVAQID